MALKLRAAQSMLESPPAAMENCLAYSSSKDGGLFINLGLKASPALSLVPRLTGPDIAEESARGLGWRTVSLLQLLCSPKALVSHFWRPELGSWAKSLGTCLDPGEVQARALVGLSVPLRASVSL